MKTKFGAIVVDGRGKIGGHVASKNRSGSYLRTKVTPVNPKSSAQATVRNRFTGLSQAWRGLSQSSREAWNAAVTNYSRTDIFGDLKNPSGFNLYQRLNNILSLVGGSLLTVPLSPSTVEAVTALTLTAAHGTPALSITFNPDSASDNTSIIVRATPAMSPGKSYVDNEYRIITVLDVEAASPSNLLASYQAIFGSIGAAGSRIFVQLIPVNYTTGQTGVASQVSAIIAA